MAMNDVDLRSHGSDGWTRKLAGFSWQAIRLPLLGFLLIVAPALRFVLTLVGLVGVLASFFFRFSGVAPNFPFWLIFGLSIACGVIVVLLDAVLHRLAR